MSKRRESITRRCKRCSINLHMCFCDAISSIDTAHHVSLIFHRKEYFLTSNTGKIANLALVNSSYQVRGLKDQPLKDDFTKGGTHTPFYLYPSEEATNLDSDFVSALDKPINLIVPDATWRQTKKFHKREPSLKDIPHVKIPFTKKSIYELRKQKTLEGLCTMEAIAYAFNSLGDAKAYNHLMNILKVMNQKVMETRTHKD